MGAGQINCRKTNTALNDIIEKGKSKFSFSSIFFSNVSMTNAYTAVRADGKGKMIKQGLVTFWVPVGIRYIHIGGDGL